MSASIGFDIFAKDRASGTFRKVGESAKSLKGDVDIMGSGLGEAGSKMAGLMTKAGMVAPALMATAGALSAAASGGVAVAGALGPVAAGGMVVYAGALAAVKQGALVARFAMKGVMEAADGDKEAMKALSPEGRRLARTFRDLGPDMEIVRRQAQAGLFPGVQSTTDRLARTYLPLLQTAARQTGNELGTLALDAGKLATSGPWQRDFQTVTTVNAINLGLMGKVGLNLANTARHLLVTGLPLVGMFLNWAVSASRTVEAMTQAGRGSGALAAFWARAATSGAIFGRILGDLGSALFTVFKIGNSSSGGGVALLGTVQQLTGQFKAWTTSAAGAKAIAAWFETGRANLAAMSRLVGTVMGGMKGIGGGAMLTPLIDQITKQVIPPLMAFLKNASASGALPALIQTVGKVIAVFAKLSENDTSLKIFAVTLGKLADGALWITREVPGASKALAAFFIVAGARSALKIAGLGGVVEGLTGMMVKLAKKILPTTAATTADTAATGGNTIAKRISHSTMGTWVGVKALELKAWVRSSAATVWATAKTVAHTVVTKAITVATKAWAVAQRVLNVVLKANPIGLVITALMLLGAGLVLAYKKSDTFRRIVDGAFRGVKTVVGNVIGFIRQHLGLMIAIMTGPMGLAIRAVIRNFDSFKAAGRRVFEAVSAAGRWMWNNALAPALRSIVGALGNVMRTWGSMLQKLGKVPGFGWATAAGDKMVAAGNKASGMATKIRNIPDRNPRVSIKTTGTDRLATLRSTLANLHDKTVNVRVEQRTYQSWVNLGADIRAGRRASGGPVRGGSPYLVGERGPELVVPRQSGMVVTASGTQRMMGGGTTGGGRQMTTPEAQIVEVHLHLEGRTIVQQVRAHKRNTGGAPTGIG